ncbi:hypothetical protein JVT61DRAFT_8778 [Boletus reticuloceps]|uniref:CHAT domain-containing protein n=1 Tax=Boletus reticuloceps TaxID=495285 RepID=A0A8I2YGZ6_9AGAM|nr:hypothetical protein JVT61DRAFT_8778 [Boletus reticuloceps]
MLFTFPEQAVDGTRQTPSTSNPYPQHTGQEQGKEDKPGSEDQPQDGTQFSGSVQEQGKEKQSDSEDEPRDQSSSSGSAMHLDENEEMIITNIRATDVALGLRRLPAGFYIMVCHSGLEWRTENKPSSVNDDVVEWSGSIPLPSGLSAIVRLELYASFEFWPMLGTGECLRKLTIAVEQVLDRNANGVPFTFFARDGIVVSPCPSIFVTIKRSKCRRSDPSAPRDLVPFRSTTEPRDELEDATNKGHGALSRYRKHGGKKDLERSITAFEWALGACPPNHPCRAAAQSNLAMAKFILCQVEDRDVSLEVPLGLFRTALVTRPVGHVDRPSTLIHLAMVHFARFEKRRDEVEGARGEALLREAMELSSTGSHENRAAAFLLRLHAGRRVDPVHASHQSLVELHSPSPIMDDDPRNLGVHLLRRFQRFGDLADLQQAIALLQRSVRSSVWNARDHVELGNLGIALWHRFQCLGELSDLEDAISTLRDAVDLVPHGHTYKPGWLSNLGTSYIARYKRFGGVSDLEDAISTLRVAVNLISHGHHDKPDCLSNLGVFLRFRFERFGQLSDLEDAISTLTDAVDLGSSRPNKAKYLNNLGSSFGMRFERLGELKDLEETISTLRDAVALYPHGHPDKPDCLGNLGLSIQLRFDRLGQLSDLEDSISTLREVVNLIPYGHTDRPRYLGNLGNSLATCFQRLGKLSDLEDAISTLRLAVDLCPLGHPSKLGYLRQLGDSVGLRFRHLWQLSDLEDAILILRDADNLTPRGHPDKPLSLNSFGNSLRARFERVGELSDLERSVSMLRDAAVLTPHGHPQKPLHLTHLNISLIARFNRLGELSDLEEAISTLRDALELTPHDHPHKAFCLHSLGNSFFIRFRHLGEPRDLENAILMSRDAIDLTPHDHLQKHYRLNGLGNSLITRFMHLGELSDLENAILAHRGAADLIPHSHAKRHDCFANLGISLITRFECLEKLSDLEDAISLFSNAVNLTPHGHPDRPRHLTDLGMSFVSRFKRLGELSDLEDAITLYSLAASTPVGPVNDRFHASQKWISCARHIRHRSLLHAYATAIAILPQLAWVGLSLKHRYTELKQGTDVVREAAATALDAGLPETAVEWLEQGRSIVWGELFQLRSSHEELSSAHPDHARRLLDLSAALDSAGATREKSLPTFLEQAQDSETLQQVADRHRMLAIKRDKLLQEIRRFPGFKRFLLQKDFSQLRASAHSGPVVFLNAAESRCDALVVLADVDHVIHVPLPKFNFQRSTGLRNVLGKLLHGRDMGSGDREGGQATRRGLSWESLLSALWSGVVKLVLDALAFSDPGDLSRIFWCPTGPFVFLPFHAAGLYGTQHSSPGHKVFDFVISSYVPTLSILAQPPNPRVASSSGLRLLVGSGG